MERGYLHYGVPEALTRLKPGEVSQERITLGLPGQTLSLQATGKVFEGSLNNNYQLSDQHGRFYLLRSPKTETPVKAQLAIWYPQQGFSPPNGIHRYRTIQEQADFSVHAAHEGVSVLQPFAVASDGSTMLVPFLSNVEPLDDYLQKGGIDAVTGVLDNLLLAHQKSIVIGDRWGANTLITQTGALEIDFDIAFEGRFAKVFELGKLLYHIVHFSSNRKQILEVLKSFTQEHKKDIAATYDLPMVQFFINRHAQLFGDTTEKIDTVKEHEQRSVTKAQSDRLLNIFKQLKSRRG